jgi:hypothetical protein
VYNYKEGRELLNENTRYLYGLTAPSRPGCPRCGGFTVTLRYSTLGKNPLDERSALRRDLYLTTRNTHMPPAGFQPAIPTRERPQTDALERAATGIGETPIEMNLNVSFIKFLV